MAAKRKITAKELDSLHDSGADMSDYLDVASSRRSGLEIQRVSVDFPIWMIESLDQEAGRLGVPRQSVIKFLISECLTGVRKKRGNKSLDPTPKNVARAERRSRGRT
jgi:hypothetical protein